MREQQGTTPEGKYFEMLLYTSSAGRLGMQVFARVKNAIFSLKPHTANSDIIIVRDEVATFKLPHE